MTAPAPAWITPATVLRVIDADTLEVAVTRKLRIRMLDCWAPEVHKTDIEGEKELGLLAKAAVERLLEHAGPEVVVRIPTEGDQSLAHVITMGRFLGDVWLGDGRSLAEVLRRRGLAAKTKDGLHQRLQKESQR